MYSEQLEQLIKSVIADGVITEKERAVLHKRAAAEGIDEDEIDVYVDGLIENVKKKVTSQVAETKSNVIEHDLSIFQKVKTEYLEYYKLIPSYTRVLERKEYEASSILFSFIDIIENKHDNQWQDLGLIFGTSDTVIKKVPTLQFMSGKNKILTLNLVGLWQCSINDYIQKDSIGDQTSNLFFTVYFLDKEMLKPLCEASNLSVMFIPHDSTSLKEIPLPYFQFYAQRFYNNIFDNSAYPDVDKKIEEEDKKIEEEKSKIKSAEKKKLWWAFLWFVISMLLVYIIDSLR